MDADVLFFKTQINADVLVILWGENKLTQMIAYVISFAIWLIFYKKWGERGAKS